MAKASKKAAAGGRKKKSGLRVLVIRHAIAGDAAEFAKTGLSDAERPLTKDGRRKMRRGAGGLVELMPDVRLIASSPLVRAIETAEIVARGYAKADRKVELVRLAALAPSRPANTLLNWLDDQSRGETIAVVGHEPHLGQFVSWALTGLRDSFIQLKKGAACLIEFEEDIRPGHAKLIWAMTPAQIRAAGKEAN